MGRTLMESDLIINLPKIKTHKYATITCAIKNMFGTIPDPLRVKYHRQLHGVLADLNSLFYERMVVVVDGLIGMEGNGPLYGTPVPLDLLLFGDDPLAIDIVASQLIGMSPSEIPHLKLFHDRYAPIEWNEVSIEGNVSLTEVIRPFSPSRLNWFLRIEKHLLPQPWFLKLIYSPIGLKYVVYPLRHLLKRVRGGASSWYLENH